MMPEALYPHFADLTLQTIVLGRDRLFIISGGDRHIGASSTAYWEQGQSVVQSCAVPGHKEYELCEQLALRAAAQLQCTVTVVMGIHYDQLTRAEINYICQKVTTLMEHYLTECADESV